MKRVMIVFLAFLVWAAFSKVQGTFMPLALFPFSKLKMIWPEYLYISCIHIGFVAYAWTLYSQETERPVEMKVAAWLVTGRFLDFALECNQGWFSLGVYAISYDTFAFLVFFAAIIRMVWRSSS